MTSANDNRTTELLPCPFCGGEAEVHPSNDWDAKFTGFTYFAWCDKCETRGDYYNTEAEAIAAWNTRTHGTLTAEQVMAIAGKHKPDYCSDTHVCFDWQAIADELNAVLGSGTCENIGYPMEFECSICGCNVSGGDELGHNSSMGEFNYCPNCGARVEGSA